MKILDHIKIPADDSNDVVKHTVTLNSVMLDMQMVVLQVYDFAVL